MTSRTQASDSFNQHLEELQKRLKTVLFAFIVVSVVIFFLSGDILGYIQQDLALNLNTFTPYEVIYTQITLSLLLAIVITLPIALFHLLQFTKPGLTQHEYKILRNFLPLAFLLFIIGSFFTYSVLTEHVLNFFQNFNAAADVTSVWGLRATIGFIMQLSFVTGIIFQIPLITTLLGALGLVTSTQMKSYRKYIIISILFIAAFTTPPDILTQIMVFMPVLILYESSIILVRYIEK